MKKNLLITVLSLMIMMTLAAAGVVYAGIKCSKHDFSASAVTDCTTPSAYAGMFGPTVDGWIEPIDEICVFCHTPHGASRNVLYTNDGSTSSSSYLWNRVVPDRSDYKLYSSATFTLQTTAPTGISLMCMSCHDGVTSIAANSTMLNPPGQYTPSQIDVDPSAAYGGALGGVFPANIGEGVGSTIYLNNDHPISFVLDASRPGIKTPTEPELKLFYNGRLECATCHDPHNNDIAAPFLRMSNTGSAMCFACHDK